MDISAFSRLELTLLEGERFRTEEPYADHTDRIVVHHIQIKGVDHVVASGPQLRANGQPGARHRNFYMSLDDLPDSIVRDICKFLLNQRENDDN